MSHGWLASESRNTRAVPWKLPRTDAGTPSSAMVLLMMSVASPSDTPSGRLKEIVAAANWPW